MAWRSSAPSPKTQGSMSSSIEHARSLVCSECWRLLFNTQSYENLCTISYPSQHRRLEYVTTQAFLAREASYECSWCELLRLLINDLFPPETAGKLPNFKAYRLSVSANVLGQDSETRALGLNFLGLQLYVEYDDWGDSGLTADEWSENRSEEDGDYSDDFGYDSESASEFDSQGSSGRGSIETNKTFPQVVEELCNEGVDDDVPTETKERYLSESDDGSLQSIDEIESPETSRTLYCTYAGFYTYSLASDPAAHYVTARPMQPDASPVATREQISSWMRECSHHTCCPPQQDMQLPKRLLYFGSPDNSISLVETRNSHSVGKYAALSYCWGSAPTYFLTKSNIEQFKVALDIQAMPRAIQDAILVAKTVPVDYLWVDALCIIQDSADDKAAEIANMQSIYRDALVTIVAANSSDASQGFLRTRPLSTMPRHHDSDKLCVFQPDTVFTIPFRMSENDFGSISLQCKDCLDKNIDGQDEPINQRAWTLQEQLLAQRVLTYTTNTLQWRCKAGIRNAGDFLCDIQHSYWTGMLRLSKSSVEAYSNDWLGLIEVFSRRKLSLPEDKLPAIAGLAEAFSERFGPRYWAGIWERGGLRQLQWVVSRDSNEGLPTDYRAPSWSWASTDSEVSYEHASVGLATMAEVLDVHTIPISRKNTFGGVSGGYIKLLGRTRQGFLVHVSSKKKRQHAPEENAQSNSKYWPLGIVWSSDKISTLSAAESHRQMNKPSRNAFDETSALYLDAAEYRGPGLVTCIMLFTSFCLILREVPNRRRKTRKAFYRIGAVAHCLVNSVFEDAIEEEITIV